MTVLAENFAVGIYEVNDITLSSATYDFGKTVKSNNTAYGAYLKDSGTITTGFIYFRYGSINIRGKDITGIYAENLNCPGLLITKCNMTLNGSNVKTLYANNLNVYSGIQLTSSNITITPVDSTTPIVINNL